MLYATTRNNIDAYTPHRVLTQKRGPEGGLFVPFRISRLSGEEIAGLGEKCFNANVADCLNLLFNTHLNSYDLDLALGRQSVRLQQLGQKILMGECWHNPDWTFDRTLKDCIALLTGASSEAVSGGWAEIGVRIAVLFGIFGSLIREDLAGQGKTVDIAVVAGDFTAPMAAWYAKAMGLPVGNILCCCNENGNLWDFICHGQLKTDGVAKQTLVPDGDFVVPEGLERLICAYAGPVESLRFAEICREGRTYYIEDGLLNRLRQGIYATVSSDKRIREIIPAAWATHRYLLPPAAALCYAGLQDYRARTGALRPALILGKNSPAAQAEICAEALGIHAQELSAYL